MCCTHLGGCQQLQPTRCHVTYNLHFPNSWRRKMIQTTLSYGLYAKFFNLCLKSHKFNFQVATNHSISYRSPEDHWYLHRVFPLLQAGNQNALGPFTSLFIDTFPLLKSHYSLGFIISHLLCLTDSYHFSCINQLHIY